MKRHGAVFPKSSRALTIRTVLTHYSTKGEEDFISKCYLIAAIGNSVLWSNTAVLSLDVQQERSVAAFIPSACNFSQPLIRSAYLFKTFASFYVLNKPYFKYDETVYLTVETRIPARPRYNGISAS